MFNTVNEAIDHAKRHGLSTSEVLEGYRMERNIKPKMSSVATELESRREELRTLYGQLYGDLTQDERNHFQYAMNEMTTIAALLDGRGRSERV